MTTERIKSSPRTDVYSNVNTPLDAVLALPNEQAAAALDSRLRAWDEIDRLHGVSFAERGQIVIAFERRMLWQFLDDPRTGVTFASFSAWMAQSSVGCRSTNYEAKRDMEALADVPADKLLEVSKSNLKVLKQLSTAVRNEPDVLQAARTLPADEFVAKLEAERPEQHVEIRKVLRFHPESSAVARIEEALQKAMDDGASTRDEALEYLAVDYIAGGIIEEAHKVAE